MKMEYVIMKVKSFGNMSYERDDNYLYVTINDFLGFDDDWNEIYNDDADESFDNFTDWLDNNCLDREGYFQIEWTLKNDIHVVVTWASSEI